MIRNNTTLLTKHHRYSWTTIKRAVSLRQEDFLTYREIETALRKKGIEVSHKTCYEWVKKFGKIIKRINKR